MIADHVVAFRTLPVHSVNYHRSLNEKDSQHLRKPFMMRKSARLLVAAICALPLSDGFVVAPSPFVSTIKARTMSLFAAMELEPEPEGGEEIVSQNTVPGCRIKKMVAVPEIASDDGEVYEFWLTATAEAAMIHEIRTTVLKDASKKANFPGFRKVIGCVLTDDRLIACAMRTAANSLLL
jgi:hypothetical protein